MEITKEYFDGEFTDKLSKKLTETMGKSFITKEHFDEAFSKVATKEDLKSFATKDDLKNMESNLETKFATKEETKKIFEDFETRFSNKFNNALAHLATQESVDDLRDRVITVEMTLVRHTTLLDKIVYGGKKSDDEEFSNTYRIGRAEKHIGQLAEQAKIELKY